MRESFVRLQSSVDHLQGQLDELRTHVDEGFAKQRYLIDQKLTVERAWAEANFKEIRASMERGFAESRAETKAAKRWLIGLVVSAVVGVAGLAA